MTRSICFTVLYSTKKGSGHPRCHRRVLQISKMMQRLLRSRNTTHTVVAKGRLRNEASKRNTSVYATAAGALHPSELLTAARKAAEKGAEVVQAALDKPRVVTFKGATDLVTETDKASEAVILASIRSAFPNHAFLGEEGGVDGPSDSEYLWVVDPIDGTTNFTHAYGAFAVSVGVLHRSTPVAGCVIEFTGGPHAWATRTFTAHLGGGAFCNGKPIRVSEVPTVNRSLLVTGFGYDHDEAWLANMELFKELTDVAQGVRRLGAASVDLCHVAMGIVDSYWEYRLKPWDVTGGIIVLTEAGGKATTMDGRPYSVFERSVLVSNGRIHDELLTFTEPKTTALKQKGIDLSRWYVPTGYKL